jgi:hypothetical protein
MKDGKQGRQVEVHSPWDARKGHKRQYGRRTGHWPIVVARAAAAAVFAGHTDMAAIGLAHRRKAGAALHGDCSHRDQPLAV